MVAGGAGGVAGSRRRSVREARRPARNGGGGAGRGRHRGLVPGPQRVRAAGARPPVAARAPRSSAQPRPAERRQGAGAVPADRADGAAGAGGRPVRRPAAQPVHALRAPGPGGLAGTDPGRGAHRRHGADPDGGPRRAAAAGRAPGGVPAAHRAAGGDQHQSQHGRPADGRRSARRPGDPRLRAGGPAGDGAVCGPEGAGVPLVTGPAPRYAVVVPTTGRPGLRRLIEALAAGAGPPPEEIVVVDDRPAADGRPPLGLPDARVARIGSGVRVLRSGGRGPAAARNTGWRAATAPWIAFLDDDVVPAPDWAARLAADLARLPDDVAGSQGNVRVPLPEHRRPTDAERGTAGLAVAPWITADMAFRRTALAGIGGFDERFRRAYREDTDLALRLLDSGYRLVRGSRGVTHPPHAAGFWASVRAQRGNADDVLMRRLHGADWRERTGSARGCFPRHVAATACGVAALAWPIARAAARRGARRPGPRGTRPGRSWARPGRSAVPPRRWGGAPGWVAAAAWAGLTAEFALARIRPGPRTRDEVLRMLVTSLIIPPAAVAYRLRGLLLARGARPPERRAVPEPFGGEETMRNAVSGTNVVSGTRGAAG
ncbi:MAG: glycosyltransferase [Streptosporangiales bacterium]|nr:glycosyltransferase [Streptosporangiales bacterium]